MKYAEQLQTEQWKKKRAKILKRDGYCCTNCGSKKELHVHHIKYIHGKMAWQVPDSYLTTLCKACHTKVHEENPLSSFIEYQDQPFKKVYYFKRPKRK